MKPLSAALTAALAGQSVALVQLVEMQLTAPLCLNTSGWKVDWDGKTWTGVAGVGRMEAVEDSPGELKGLKFELSGVPSSMLSLVLSEPVQGKTVNVYTGVYNSNIVLLDAVLEWSGRLDTMAIAEDGERSTITVTAENAGIDLFRPSGIKFSHQDQQRLHPGDDFFEYVIDQAEATITWPAAAFFRA